MAIRYVDLLNGVDANNGTTFALRKKTLASASIGLTAGDTIRVMKTSDPTLIGSCTWAAANNYITLPAAVNAVINTCEVAWTASANITSVVSTTSGQVRQGTNCVKITPAAGFTTGKMAYSPCATVNLSGYQQVSFYFSSTLVVAANSLYLDLCSDALGATPVASFLIPQFTTAPTSAVPLTFNFGANLSATVNSVALRAAIDPGVNVFSIDNIIACKAASAADSLTLNSIIGLNTADEPEWYPIRCIEGTKVTLDTYSLGLTTLWSGSVGSLPTYKLEPLRIQQVQTSLSALALASPTSWIMAAGGTSAGLLNIEGGWDTTAMTTQTGITAFDFQSWAGAGLPSTKDYLYINNIVSVRGYDFYTNFSSVGTNFKFGTIHGVGPYNFSTLVSTTGMLVVEGENLYVTCPINYAAPSLGQMVITNFSLNYRSSNYVGINAYYQISASGLMVENFKILGWQFLNFANVLGSIKNFTFGGTGTGVSTGVAAASTTLNIDNYVCSNSTYAFNLVSFTPCVIKCNQCTTTNVTTTIVAPPALQSYQDKTRVTIASLNGATVGTGTSTGVLFSAVTTPVHTSGAEKYAWQVSVPNDKSKLATDTKAFFKHKLNIGQVLVNGGSAVTITIWAYRLFTTSYSALFVQPEFAPLTDYVFSKTTGAANTWEQLTITFTPTSTTVVDIYVGAQFDGTNATQKFYFDDFSVSQV